MAIRYVVMTVSLALATFAAMYAIDTTTTSSLERLIKAAVLTSLCLGGGYAVLRHVYHRSDR